MNGNLSIEPDITNGGDDTSACIFVASGNITIEDGTNQSDIDGSDDMT